jgi:site-specific recombinase XerD
MRAKAPRSWPARFVAAVIPAPKRKPLGLPHGPPRPRSQVERIAAQYLKHARARTRASTWRETKRVFDREILPAWRGRRLSGITKADVRKLIEGVAKRGAPVGANRLLASLKTFFAFAIEQDLISASPAAAIRPPAPETAR